MPVAAVMWSDYLLSFGMALDWEFERQFDSIKSLKAIHCYDHTVSQRSVARMGIVAALKAVIGSVPRKRLPIVKLALSYFRFFGQRHVRHISLAVESRDSNGGRSFETALEFLAHGAGRVFLKCDIEGSEYVIAKQICRRHAALTGMVVEFHDIASNPDRFYSTLEALMSNFAIVHIHANNCVPLGANGLVDVLEVSFLNRSLADQADGRHVGSVDELLRGWHVSMDGRELDAPNTTAAAEIDLCYR